MIKIVVELQTELETTAVGAKAANLGKAMANGFRVPPGFVLTRNALDMFLQQAALKTTVEEFVSRSALAENEDRAADFDDLCRQIRTAPIPELLTDAVTKIAEPLLAGSTGGVAVRSSGVHEDSATASFAGVYESYLGVRSVEELWVAIKECWCAAWTPQAIAYAKRMGITPEYDAMAVLIQQLVVADSAGVLFTANPRTGNPWQFILESTFGLAQELVGSAGDVAADRFVLAWDTGQITERLIAEKSTTCVLGESGVHSVPVAEERRATPSLSDAMATSIAKLALAIDRIFGCRVDIEWAVADAEIHIVQVRPITALPTFFPHHLPTHVADKTWEPTWPYWYFSFGGAEGAVVPPLYCDLSYAEMFARYQMGPIELHPYRFVGIETDFNGHRYRAGTHRWPQKHVLPEQMEAYLREYEPALRQQWIDAKRYKFPDLVAKAIEYQHHAHSVPEQIEALLWARDAIFDLTCFTAGPSATLHHVCNDLFNSFVTQFLPDVQVNALKQGHHPDLEPYFPHVQVQEAEALASTIGEGPIRDTFESMDVQSIFQYLLEHPDASPFARAYGAYCERCSLVPPNRPDEIIPKQKAIHYSVIQVARDAFLGKSTGLAAKHEQAMQRRRAYETELRQILAKQEPDSLPRFEHLLDCIFFWLPSLNDRGWASAPRNQIHRLWNAMCRKLQAAGLVDTPTDMRYFTVDDLAYIAQTGDIEEGRRIWQRRRLAYERVDRLQPPLHLCSTPDKPAPDNAARATPSTNERTAKASAEAVIHGRGSSPGRAKGIAHKIETFDEAGAVTDQHVLVLTKPVTPTHQYTGMLLTLILRVRGIIIVQAGNTYTHHIAQIARECAVPVLEISPDDLDHIPESAELVVDGSAGTVTII